jgi:hypothetical protein
MSSVTECTFILGALQGVCRCRPTPIQQEDEQKAILAYFWRQEDSPRQGTTKDRSFSGAARLPFDIHEEATP